MRWTAEPTFCKVLAEEGKKKQFFACTILRVSFDKNASFVTAGKKMATVHFPCAFMGDPSFRQNFFSLESCLRAPRFYLNFCLQTSPCRLYKRSQCIFQQSYPWQQEVFPIKTLSSYAT